MRSTSRTMPTM